LSVRVEPDELGAIAARVIKEGRPYRGVDLEGAALDADHALVAAGFTPPEFIQTSELKQMVVYRCRPNWSPVQAEDVVRRLEDGWVEDGAFEQESHSIAVSDELVSLEFVTWWDDGAFYTGRIEVIL
jgi:hypothetical protein